MFWNSYPLIRYTLAFTAGIILYTQTSLPLIALVLTGFVTLSLYLYFHFLEKQLSWLSGPAGLVTVGIVGWLFTAQADDSTRPDYLVHLPGPVEGYRAVLSSAVETKSNTFRVTAQVEQVRIHSRWMPARGKVLLFIDRNVPHKPAYGDELLVRKVPERVEPPHNPDEFNYQHYLKYQGIAYQQYLHVGEFVRLSKRPPSRLVQLALQVNESATALLAQHLTARNELAVASAMLLGVRDELDSDLLRAYSAAGAVHTLSVSGMHVGILFLVLSWFLQPLRKGSSYKKWVFIGIVFTFLWGYALLTGLSAPVLRSAIMLSVFVIGDTFRLSRNSFNTLTFSALVILVFNPYALFQMGFQLSYLSVAGILYLYPRLHWLWQPANPLWAELWSLSCGAVAAQVVTYPLAVYYFHQFPTYFLLVNPLVLGLSSLGLIVGMLYLLLYGVPLLNDFLLYCVKLSFGLLNQLVFYTENWPGARWNRLMLTDVQLLLLYGILVLFVVLFATRRKIYLWPCMVLAFGFAMTKLYAYQQQRKQHWLVVHHLKKHTAVSFIHGRALHLLADSLLYTDRRMQELHLEQFWTARGIHQTHHTFVQSLTPFGQALCWQGKRVLWIRRPLPRHTSLRSQQTIDLFLISNNALRYPPNWLRDFPVRQIVLDVTNSRRVAERWRTFCTDRNIACYDVRTRGAFVVSW